MTLGSSGPATQAPKLHLIAVFLAYCPAIHYNGGG